MINNYSEFSVFRFNYNDTEKQMLEVWDPKSNLAYNICPESFIQLSDIRILLEKINASMKNKADNKEVSDKYFHWQKMGWGKSLDYYLASRVDAAKIEDTDRKEERSIKVDGRLIPPYSLLEALFRRRTKRVFHKKTMSKEVFYSGLINMALLSKNDILSGIEFYIVIYNVENISPGVYWLNFWDASLSLVTEGLFSNEMSDYLQGMRAPKTAAFTIILVADFEKLLARMPYAKGLRDVYIESGRVAQKFLISYGQYNIFCLPTPALCDRAVSKLLKLNEPDFSPIYSLTFGHPIE